MDFFVRRFIKASLCWLLTGVSLGVAMAFGPQLIIYRPAHVHANLLGFVSMMIFGVAYHVIPRFSGAPLHNRRLASAHFFVANLGLIGIVGGFLAIPRWSFIGRPMLHTGAGLTTVGVVMFVYNIWRTMDGAAPRLNRV